MADRGHLYELPWSEPPRFRARGLDAAYRVRVRVEVAMRAALEADPEVIEVEDRGYLREGAMRCDGTAACRGGSLHDHGCPRRA